MKCIKIKIVEQNPESTVFRISCQTDRYEYFGRKSTDFPDGWAFVASNGVRLLSFCSPHVAEDKKTGEIDFWTRGHRVEEDSKLLIISTDGFNFLKEAIAEYNEHFKGE